MQHGPRGLAGEKHKLSRPMGLLLKTMFGHLGRFKRVITVAAILAIVGMVFMAIDPLVLAWGIDAVLEADADFNAVLILGVLFLALKITSWVLGSVNTWILAGAQAGFVQSLQQHVYDKLVRADLSYHKGEQSGDVTSRVTSDTDNLSMGIQIIIDLASQVLLLVVTFILMWMASPYVALNRPHRDPRSNFDCSLIWHCRPADNAGNHKGDGHRLRQDSREPQRRSRGKGV